MMELKDLSVTRDLKAIYNFPFLTHVYSTVFSTDGLESGCIVELKAIVGCRSTDYVTVISADTVVEPYCFIGGAAY